MTNSGVYLFKTSKDNLVVLKIGSSKHIDVRIKEHRLSNPLLEFIGYIETKDYKWLEKDIQYKSRKYLYKGEFYFNNENIVNYFLNHENFKNI